MDAALAEIKAEAQTREKAAIDKYLAQKRQEAEGTTVSPQEGGSPTGARKPKNLDDAFGAARSRMRAMRDGSP